MGEYVFVIVIVVYFLLYLMIFFSIVLCVSSMFVCQVRVRICGFFFFMGNMISALFSFSIFAVVLSV